MAVRILTPVIWWATHVLLSVLLYRAWRTRLIREYTVFYGYVAYVLCSSLILFRLSLVSRQAYAIGYWVAEFASAIFGIGIIWEVYGAAFAFYPGVRRMGRVLIAGLVLAVTGKAVADVATRPMRVLFPTTVELERNLRFVEAVLLLAILLLVLYYRVPLGRNVRNLLYGYALYIGSVVITLTLQSAWGKSFLNWWTALQPLAYLVTLVIWCLGLCSRVAEPPPNRNLEGDYERASEETARGLARLRSRVIDTLR